MGQFFARPEPPPQQDEFVFADNILSLFNNTEAPNLDHFLPPPSRFKGMFDEDDDETWEEDKPPIIELLNDDTDGNDDNDDVDDEWTEGEEERRDGEKKKEREVTRVCKHCGVNSVTPERSVKCPLCQAAIFCSAECLDKGKMQHSAKCLKNADFKYVENCIKSTHGFSQQRQGRQFGTLRDVPGAEHGFLGGSKTNLVLRVGRRRGSFYDCQDIEGNRTKLQFENRDPSFVQGFLQNVGTDDNKSTNLFIAIFGASHENLESSHHNGRHDNLCIKLNRDDAVTYFKLGARDGERVLSQIVPFEVYLA